jgi:glyoxylase-like metal-dependent hydrolase (beta-lactamase superfamily II)
MHRGRNLREIEFNGSNNLKIGQFPAYDYFGDGSFYLLDSPGHAIGHLCSLIRTTTNPDTFVLLGGDICHHGGIFRPSKHLPLPSSISPNPLAPGTDKLFCPGSAFEELQKERGMNSQGPILKPEFGHDIPLALHTIDKLQELDVDENILVIIAHDKFARDVLDHFPLPLNLWKERGWGEKLRWAFLKDFEPYWRSKGVV